MAAITVNGKSHEVAAPPDTPLLYVLRNELALYGPKYACRLAQCGACLVPPLGEAARSCTTAVSAASAPVTTGEGLRSAERPHPVQRAFIGEQAAQCGYCTNGMIMTTVAFLAQTPRPTEAQIRAALDGNLCRCGTHM